MKHSLRRTSLLLALAVICIVPGMPGCAIYVNIPRDADSPARYDPNIPTVVEAMGRSVEAVAQRWPDGAAWVLELPALATVETYAIVAAWAPDHIVVESAPEDDAMTASVSQTTLTVSAVRIRGTEAQVDLQRPTGSQTRQLVTVFLRKRPFEPWRVERLRPWRLGADSDMR